VDAQNCVAGLCFGLDTMWLAGSFALAGVAGSSSEKDSSSEIGAAEFRTTIRVTLGALPYLS
jgi:hypothetical protein